MNLPPSIAVVIPSIFSRFVGGQNMIALSAATVGDAIAALVETNPEMRSQLHDSEGRLLRYLQLFVNDDNINDLSGLETRLNDGDELLLIAALAGG